MKIFFRLTVISLLFLILFLNLISFETVKNIIRPYIPVNLLTAKDSLKENFKYNQISHEINDEILETLKNGNNTLFIRHSHKLPKEFQQGFDVLELNGFQSDYINNNNCLTDRGKEEAKFIGILFNQLKLPIDEVYTSPICRCVETANIAFQKYIIKDFLAYLGIVSVKDRINYTNETKNLFYQQPKQNYNNIIVGHGSTPKLVGLKLPDIGQSAIIIYNHDDNNVRGVLEFNKLVHAFYEK